MKHSVCCYVSCNSKLLVALVQVKSCVILDHETCLNRVRNCAELRQLRQLDNGYRVTSCGSSTCFSIAMKLNFYKILRHFYVDGYCLFFELK